MSNDENLNKTPPNSKQFHGKLDCFARNIPPILALITVLLTFFMFWYFIHIADNPVQEIKTLSFVQQKYDTAVEKFKNEDADRKEQARKELDNLQQDVFHAKADLEELNARSAMVKDFVLYILGVLSSVLTTIFGYYFGSSKSNSKKDDTLIEIAKRPTQ